MYELELDDAEPRWLELDELDLDELDPDALDLE